MKIKIGEKKKAIFDKDGNLTNATALETEEIVLACEEYRKLSAGQANKEVSDDDIVSDRDEKSDEQAPVGAKDVTPQGDLEGKVNDGKQLPLAENDAPIESHYVDKSQAAARANGNGVIITPPPTMPPGYRELMSDISEAEETFWLDISDLRMDVFESYGKKITDKKVFEEAEKFYVSNFNSKSEKLFTDLEVLRDEYEPTDPLYGVMESEIERVKLRCKKAFDATKPAYVDPSRKNLGEKVGGDSTGAGTKDGTKEKEQTDKYVVPDDTRKYLKTDTVSKLEATLAKGDLSEQEISTALTAVLGEVRDKEGWWAVRAAKKQKIKDAIAKVAPIIDEIYERAEDDFKMEKLLPATQLQNLHEYYQKHKASLKPEAPNGGSK